jgi:valyl-tRNA synthetase
MEPYFESMACAKASAWGMDVKPPATSAHVSLPGIEVYVDLQDFIDIQAEITRNEKLASDLTGRISSKAKKLENENFVSRAPAEVVAKERESLAEMQQQLASVQTTLEDLRRQM